MSDLTCYRCNEELTKEEAQKWEPFGLCNMCKSENAITQYIEHSLKEEVRLYWQLPQHWQARLRDIYRR